MIRHSLGVGLRFGYTTVPCRERDIPTLYLGMMVEAGPVVIPYN